jgi:sulfite reductase beta subunit
MATQPTAKRITDIGPPNYEKFLHPVITKNYGQWKYHETLAPGVLCHVAESGDKLYTVRAGSPRLLSIQSLRLFADLADKYCGGHLRFTSRNNVEFLFDDVAKIEPLKQELQAAGFPVGGTNNSISNIVHTRAGSTAILRPRMPRAWSRASWTSCASTSPRKNCRPSCASRWPAA